MKSCYLIKIIISFVLFPSLYIFAEEGFYLLGTMTGKGENDCYYHVAGVGDVNGDGYDDSMVGASAGGYADLYLGSALFDTLPDIVFRPPTQGATYGKTICGDDWNGDGYSDIAIGEPHWCVGEYPDAILQAGKVWVYFGGEQIDTIPDLELVVGDLEEFSGWYYRFGSSIADGGDVNGDGYHDLIVGAPHDDYDAHGRVYIYFGGPEMDDEYDVLLEGEDHMDMFGSSIDIAGDINRDGFDDLIIGAPQTLAQLDVGKAYLVYGGNKIELDNSELFAGDSTLYYFGRYVSGLGDINADGITEFGVMADKYLRIFSGGNLQILEEIKVKGDWGSFHAICGNGDINNDNIQDMLIGIENRISQYTGKLLIYLGRKEVDSIPDFEISGKVLQGDFANNIAYLGDINNDNNTDIIVGETFQGKGKVYIYSYGKINSIMEDPLKPIPTRFNLFQNYPNPFNNHTKIKYELGQCSDVNLDIFNIKGQKICSLFNGSCIPGTYHHTWNGKDDFDKSVPCGMYFCRLVVTSGKKKHAKVKKMLFLK